jgi:hypothetical protein
MAIMRDAGIQVCESPSTLGKAMKELLSGKKPRGRQEVPPVAKAPSKPPAKPVGKGAPKAGKAATGKASAGKAASPRRSARKNPSKR